MVELVVVRGFGREEEREDCQVRRETGLEDGGCWRLEGEVAPCGLHVVAAVVVAVSAKACPAFECWD